MTDNADRFPYFQEYPFTSTDSMEDLRAYIKRLEEQVERRRLEERKRQLEDIIRSPPFGGPRITFNSPPDYHTGDFPAYRPIVGILSV